MWRVARSLEILREQVNRQFPNRNKSADGTIGDAAHRARGKASDHNPWLIVDKIGVVTALDITHDLKNGPDTWALAEHLRQKRDSRIKMIISNHRLFTVSRSPWVWRPYTGGNPHSHHVHISVSDNPILCDNTRAWDLAWERWPISSSEPDLVRPVLRFGSNGEAVKDLQNALDLSVDGVFGPMTDSAVRAFQREQRIAADGVVGPVTWEKLDIIAERD